MTFILFSAHSKSAKFERMTEKLEEKRRKLEPNARKSVLAQLYNDMLILDWEKEERALTNTTMNEALALIVKDTRPDDVI